MSNVCLLFFFLQDLITWYQRFMWMLQLWAALGTVLAFLWPAGAVYHLEAQAMVVSYIPSGLLRFWELWSVGLDLWERF